MMLDELIELLTTMREALDPLRPLEVKVLASGDTWDIGMVTIDPVGRDAPARIVLDCDTEWSE